MWAPVGNGGCVTRGLACVSQQAFAQKRVSAFEDHLQSGLQESWAPGECCPGRPAEQGCATRVGRRAGTATSSPTLPREARCCLWAVWRGLEPAGLVQVGSQHGSPAELHSPALARPASAVPCPGVPRAQSPVLLVYRGAEPGSTRPASQSTLDGTWPLVA